MVINEMELNPPDDLSHRVGGQLFGSEDAKDVIVHCIILAHPSTNGPI